MKKVLAFLLIAALVLPGCASQNADPAPALSAPKQKVTEDKKSAALPAMEKDALPEPSQEAEVPETQEEEELTEKAEATKEEEAPEKEEIEKKEEAPKKEEIEKKEENSTPAPTPEKKPSKQETPATTPSKQEMPATTPSAPAAPSKPAAPSGSNRPVSYATCKDTGSSAIWEDPDASNKDYYEETDPQRTAYLEYLKAEGNEFYFWIQEEDMRMYLGRNYAIPLYTSYEMFTNCTWTSSDESVLSVNQVGYATPHQAGTAVITVSYNAKEGEEPAVRQCQVTVKEYPQFTIAQLEQRAHEEAKKIANYALNYDGANTDLERIAVATALVHEYVKKSGPANVSKIIDGEIVSYPVTGYNQPFGTLVSFHSSCAGDTRAMGLVLEYMGFQWYHTNANQWDHQWCVVYDVDGQTAFADASAYGMVGYGQRAEDGSNGLIFRYGSLVSASS